MKIQQPSNRTRIVVASGVIAALIAAGLGYYIFASHGSLLGWTPYPRKDSSGTHPATQEQIDNGAKIKEQSLNNDKTKSGTSGSDQPPAPVPQSNGKSAVQVTITAVNQTTSTLQLRSLISILDTTGTCILTLQKQNSTNPPVSETVGVQPLANTATCKGFDIPLNQLSAGTWKATLSFDSAQYTGNTSQIITIK